VFVFQPNQVNPLNLNLGQKIFLIRFTDATLIINICVGYLPYLSLQVSKQLKLVLKTHFEAIFVDVFVYMCLCTNQIQYNISWKLVEPL